MRKALKIITVAAALALPLAAASGLYAHESQGPTTGAMPSTMSGSGVMGQSNMMGMMDAQGNQMPGEYMPQTAPQTPDTNG